jgi:rod shape-determining protein MreC
LLGSGLSEAFYGFSHGVKETTAMYVDLVNIKHESADLKSTNNELMSRLEKMNELQNENNRLKDLLDFKQSTKMQLVSAQIIGRDLLVDHNTVTINKGSRDGLKSGQAVITTGGVLGYIYKPDAFTSHVMLISDSYAVVDGIVARTRAHGIVEGKGKEASLTLKYVEKTEDVKDGDLVVTGGLDNIFPKGFPVAIVDKVERKTFSVSLKVDLRPIVNPYQVEEVFVVLNAAMEDLTNKYAPVADNSATPVLPGTPNPTAAPAVAAPAPVKEKRQ